MVAVISSSGLTRLIWGEEEGLQEEAGLEEACTLLTVLRPHQHPHPGKDKVDKTTTHHSSLDHRQDRDRGDGGSLRAAEDPPAASCVAVGFKQCSVRFRRTAPIKGNFSTPAPSPEKNSVGSLSGRMMFQHHTFTVAPGEGEEEEEVGTSALLAPPLGRRELHQHAVCVGKWDTQRDPVPRQGATKNQAILVVVQDNTIPSLLQNVKNHPQTSGRLHAKLVVCCVWY